MLFLTNPDSCVQCLDALYAARRADGPFGRLRAGSNAARPR